MFLKIILTGSVIALVSSSVNSRSACQHLPNTKLIGEVIEYYWDDDARSPSECARLCVEKDGCNFWTYKLNTKDQQVCDLFSSVTTTSENGFVSGSKCVLSAKERHRPKPSKSDCGSQPSWFQFPNGLSWANPAWGGEEQNYDGEQVVNVDLFDTSKTKIELLKHAGHVVSCYISTGTKEDWRSDAGENWPLAKKMEWPGEWWLDITNLEALKPLMTKRFELAAKKGCDAIEGDNVDCYQNDCISKMTQSQLRPYQIAYNTFQVDLAHSLGMAMGLKNSVGLVKDMVDQYDFAVNEECKQWEECHLLKPFEKSGKAIFGTEYVKDLSEGPEVCRVAEENGMATKYIQQSTDNDGVAIGDGFWKNCFPPAAVVSRSFLPRISMKNIRCQKPTPENPTPEKPKPEKPKPVFKAPVLNKYPDAGNYNEKIISAVYANERDCLNACQNNVQCKGVLVVTGNKCYSWSVTGTAQYPIDGGKYYEKY
eukprot:Awhi_evm1s10740